MRQATVSVDMSQAPARRFGIMIFSSEKTLDQARDCIPPLPSMRATLNGVPLERFRGVYASGDFGYNRDCIVDLGFVGPIPEQAKSAGPAIVRLEHEGDAWTVEIPDAFTPRKLTLMAPAEGVLRRGQTATFQWSPSTDRLLPLNVSLTFRRKGGGPHEFVIVDAQHIRVAGGRLLVPVPVDIPPTFDGPLEIHFSTWPPFEPATRCPVRKCLVNLDFSMSPLAVALGN